MSERTETKWIELLRPHSQGGWLVMKHVNEFQAKRELRNAKRREPGVDFRLRTITRIEEPYRP